MLYSVQTGERVNADPSKWAQLLATDQYNFAPDEQVSFVDSAGKIVQVQGDQAARTVLDYSSGLRPATDDDIRRFNTQNLAGGIGQQALTLAESGASGFTLGLSDIAATKAIEATAGKEAGKQYQEAKKMRQEANPATAVGGELVGLVAPTGLASKVAKGAANTSKKLVTPVVKELTQNKALQKGAEKVGQYLLEGGAIDGVYEFSRQTVDDSPYNADALLDRTAEGALFNTAIGGTLELGIRGASKALNKTGEVAQKYLDKFTMGIDDIPTPKFYEVGANELDRADNILSGGKVVEAKKTPEGNVYSDGKKKVLVNTDNMTGLDLTNKQTMDALGSEYGIDNLSQKYKTFKLETETLPEFIERTKNIDEIKKDLLGRKDYLQLEDQRKLDDAVKTKEFYAAQNLEGKATKKEMQQIAQEINAIDDEIRDIEKRNRVGGKTDEVAEVQRSQELDKIKQELDNRYQYLDDGQNIYIKPESLTGQFSAEVIQKSKEALSKSTKGILTQYKPTAKKIARYANEELNEVADYIKSKYPNQLTKFKDVKTSPEYIYTEILKDIENSSQKRHDAVIEMNNIAENEGKQLWLTNADIANYLESNVLPQYASVGAEKGKRILVPTPGQSDKFKAIQKLVDEYRASGKQIDPVTGMVSYEPLNIKEAIAKRVEIDQATDWTTLAEKAVNDANKNIREFIEDKVASRAKRASPQAFEKYVQAKKELKNQLRARDIVENSYNKALKSTGYNPSAFRLGIGAALGAPLGAPAAIAAGLANEYVGNIFRNHSGNLAAYLANGIADEGIKYLKKIDSAAVSFIDKSGTTRRAIVGLTGKDAEDQMWSDKEKFENELMDAQNFTEKFMQENEELMRVAPQSVNSLLQKAGLARQFLLSKIPQNPYEGVPYRQDLWKPSSQDVQRYTRYREAVLKPSAILEQVSDGYITPEAAEVLQIIYPETLQRLKGTILEKVKGNENIPIEKRLQIEKLFGVQLESNPFSFQIYQSNGIESVNKSIAQKQPQGQTMTTGQQTQLQLGETAL